MKERIEQCYPVIWAALVISITGCGGGGSSGGQEMTGGTPAAAPAVFSASNGVDGN